MIEMQNMDGTDMIPDLRYRFFDENNDVLLYNIFHAELVIRHSENRKMCSRVPARESGRPDSLLSGSGRAAGARPREQWPRRCYN